MTIATMVEDLLGGDLPVAVEAYDGSRAGPADAHATLLIRSPVALQPGMRLLDIGCGWGGMAMHAAREHGVIAVGVTLSTRQAELAEKRVAEAGLGDRVEIRMQDYRNVRDGPYDAISSIGMFEHVGLSQVKEYFDCCHALL